MLVEHAFVTTRQPAEVLPDLAHFLTQLGFELESKVPPNVVEATRGKKRTNASSRISTLLQRVHLSYDRGRISVAASVDVKGKEVTEHETLLFALANSLERAALGTQPRDSLLQDWAECQRIVNKHARFRRGASVGCLVFLILMITGLIIAAIAAR